ncbi:CPBP family glutamic-type intramembrane protease, partial [Salmonella enterica subsp. enterica]|nr:CPBP family intramembrane metalloprotease [Salmonella enterica subsp. enterica serovar Mbandaka]EAV3183531.1 CPBP family intramembrane metalloprotease [Salmonella enterica subsp. enterica]EEH0793335.1 CPBP family intramembrane metalloprotease [Salmonella enterica subsp. enterica serovar Schwarzengrund]EGF1376117.1 CPBP family intramembrane metalloprotease [Salmonella enterica subsp. enterica serovar 4,[5],12:d:-]EIA9512954.1 CPBP family intramembrane metalloprotease [Salmonella enterica]HBR
QPQPTDSWQRLTIGILYGGIAEEIMARWGLMSLVLWILFHLSGLLARRWIVVCAILLSALAFGGAHLPALAVQVDLDTNLVIRTLMLNGLGGVLYGWLFWRYHLESAMVSHAASHLILVACQLGNY